MKRLITFAALLFASLGAFAQGGMDMIAEVWQNSRLSFSYSYETKVSNVPVKVSGNAVIQDFCYVRKDNGLEIYNDGVTKWTVDSDAKEVYIEKSGGRDEFIGIAGSYMNSLSDVRFDNDSVSGSVLENGVRTDFKASGIRTEPKSDKMDAFRFDTSKLDSSWVVTDLR